MTPARRALETLNKMLVGANLRVETLTKQRSSEERLARLRSEGHWERPLWPLPAGAVDRSRELLETLKAEYGATWDAWPVHPPADGSFGLENGYYQSGDAEILHGILRQRRPKLVVEIGSGWSSRIVRQALDENGGGGRLVSVDPQPRTGIERWSDEHIARRIEDVGDAIVDRLAEGDVLFIDSSHEGQIGDDVIYLYLRILPRLRTGVIVHIHDIFLPYEYPRTIVDSGWDWREQYFLSLLLQTGGYDILWAGYALHRADPEYVRRAFPRMITHPPQAFWMQRR